MNKNNHTSHGPTLPPQVLALCAAKALLKTIKQQAQMHWLFHFTPNNKI